MILTGRKEHNGKTDIRSTENKETRNIPDILRGSCGIEVKETKSVNMIVDPKNSTD